MKDEKRPLFAKMRILCGIPADEKIICRFRDIAAAPAACGWIHIIIELKVL